MSVQKMRPILIVDGVLVRPTRIDIDAEMVQREQGGIAVYRLTGFETWKVWTATSGRSPLKFAVRHENILSTKRPSGRMIYTITTEVAAEVQP